MYVNWFIFPCRSNKEQKALDTLKDRGLNAWTPFQWDRKFDRRYLTQNKNAPKQIAVFPGYLFIRIDLNYIGWFQLNEKPPEVSPVLALAGKPCSIEHATVADLIAQHGDTAPRIDNAGTYGAFKPGDAARVIDGPFADMAIEVTEITGKFAIAYMELFGSVGRPVKFDMRDLEPV